MSDIMNHNIFTDISSKIAKLALAFDKPKLIPKLFYLQCQGINIGRFLELNQPWLIGADIKTVLDIGASIGQFASVANQIFPSASIYSFELLQDCYEKLKVRMQKINGFKAFNIALGDFDGEIKFHRNEYSLSSSVLPMADLHKHNFPYTTRESIIKVRIAKLDDFIKDLNIEENLLVKMDVQGFEDKVITGGINTIKKASIIILETSFQSSYKGQPLFEDIYDLLKEDFKYMGSLDQRLSPINGSALFSDSIFVRRTNNMFH